MTPIPPGFSQDVLIDGKKAVGYVIDMGGASLVAVKADKGFVMCGFLDIRAVDKFGLAAAVVRGIKSVDDLLAKPVSDVSVAAQALGVLPGMTGRDALAKFF